MYRANKSELSYIEILTKNLHGYHNASFTCAKFQVSLETLQLFSDDF